VHRSLEVKQYLVYRPNGADVAAGDVLPVRHHLRGQNFALLDGAVSEPTDVQV